MDFLRRQPGNEPLRVSEAVSAGQAGICQSQAGTRGNGQDPGTLAGRFGMKTIYVEAEGGLVILPMTALIAFLLAGIGMAAEVAVPFWFRRRGNLHYRLRCSRGVEVTRMRKWNGAGSSRWKTRAWNSNKVCICRFPFFGVELQFLQFPPRLKDLGSGSILPTHLADFGPVSLKGTPERVQ